MRNDMTGQVFGRLTVLSFDRMQGKSSRWNCQCECGNVVSIFRVSLVKQAGGTRSCGCYRREFIAAKNLTHGKSRIGKITPEYRAWANIKDRCVNPKNKRFKHYGGRGITYCNRWESFENFLSDMGKRPSKYHSIDRIDNNGNYSKKNCRWATMDQQNANRQGVTLITAHGMSMTAGQWSKLTCVDRSTISRRIRRGVIPELAIGHFKLARER